jgi:hypothetical protein
LSAGPDISCGGIPIQFSVSGSNGSFHFLNPDLRDTTDYQGRVNFRYVERSVTQTGSYALHVQDGMHNLGAVVQMNRLSASLGTIQLTMSGRLLFLEPGDTASTEIWAGVRDAYGNDDTSRHAELWLEYPLGWLERQESPRWICHYIYRTTEFGRGGNTVHVGTNDGRFAVASFVIQTVGDVQIVTETDTLRYLPGDSVSCEGYAVVTDQFARALMRVPVHMWLEEPLGFLQFTHPEMRDSTNGQGQLPFRYTVYAPTGPGENIIHARVGQHVSDRRVVVMPVDTTAYSISKQRRS